MKTPFLAIAAMFAAAAALAAPRGPRASQNHVPESLDGIRAFNPEAANYNHIALVNVADAIDAADWARATTYAVSLLQINVWTNSIAASVADRLYADASYTAKALGNEKAKVGVFLENRPGAPRVMAVPGAWSVVNVADLKADNPPLQVYRDRVAKCVMKGLAAAGGGGATLEPFCSLFYGAHDIQGMDKTNIAISPMCYFPMLEILRSVGGNEILAPVSDGQEEDEE